MLEREEFNLPSSPCCVYRDEVPFLSLLYPLNLGCKTIQSFIPKQKQDANPNKQINEWV